MVLGGRTPNIGSVKIKMSTTQFNFCFLGRDGNIVCQHHNGSWIVFPAYGGRKKKKEPSLKAKALPPEEKVETLGK